MNKKVVLFFVFLTLITLIFSKEESKVENNSNSGNSIDIQIESMVDKKIEQVLNKKSSEWGIEGENKTASEIKKSDENTKQVNKNEINKSVNTNNKNEYKSRIELFGINMFNMENGAETPSDTNVGKEYVLSAGDYISISMMSEIFALKDFQGGKSGFNNIKIPPSGNIVIPEIGIFSARGKKVEELEAAIKESGVKKYKDFKVEVTVTKLRSVNVFIFGEVNIPGLYSMSPNSTVLSAFYKAGGIKENASIRKVRILRNGKTMEIDLYEHLLFGNKANDIKLSEGDTIFVPPTANSVTVLGAVLRPAIYEITGKESLKDILEMAGGIKNGGYTLEIRVRRVDDKGKEVIATSELDKFIVKAGDIVEIGEVDSRIKKSVTLLGNFTRPGIYEFEDGDKFSKILQKAGGFKKESYTERIEIKRVKSDTTFEKYGFNFSSEDPVLMGEDEIRVYSIGEASAAKRARVSGEVKQAGTYTIYDNSRVSDLIFAAKGLNEDKVHYGRADLYRVDTNGELKVIKVDLIKVMRGDKDADIELKDYDYLKVYSEEEAVGFSEVYIYGEVKSPGKFNYLTGMTISDLIFYAKGMKISADKSAVEIIRSSIEGNGIEVIIVDINKEPNFILKEYDQVFIRKIPNWEEKKTVKLNGYVKYPGEYAITDKDTLNSIIKRAGGFSTKAFPKGLRFYRKKNFEEYLKGLNIKFEQDLIDRERIVLSNISFDSSKGEFNENIVLKDGDEIEIPEIPNYVTVMGEVYIPGMVVYEKGLKMKSYINASGGYTDKAFEAKSFVIKYNGKTERNGWFKKVKIEPGDTIMVPVDNRTKGAWDRVLTILDGVAKVATTVLLIKNVTK